MSPKKLKHPEVMAKGKRRGNYTDKNGHEKLSATQAKRLRQKAGRRGDL